LILVDIFGEERAQFITVLRPASEEAFAHNQKFLVSFVVFVVENFLFEKFPQPFHQIQIPNHPAKNTKPLPFLRQVIIMLFIFSCNRCFQTAWG